MQFKSEFNGNVTVTKDKKWITVQSTKGSRFPTTQTCFSVSQPLRSKYILYPQGMTTAITSNTKELLLIGVAGGFMVNYINHHCEDINLHAVEIDPVMVEILDHTFPNIKDKVITQCGFDYLEKANQTFDTIMIDAFHGYKIPEIFVSEEFISLLKLKCTGTVAINIILNEDSIKVAKTYISNFKNCIALYQGGNLFLTLSDREISHSTAIQNRYNFMYPIPELIRRYRIDPNSIDNYL